MRRVVHLTRRVFRVMRDGSRITAPISIILMAAVTLLVLQVEPHATAGAKLMIAAPRYTKDLDIAIVTLDAIETARVVYRDLLSTSALRRAAYQADLSPSAFAPHATLAAMTLRGSILATSATDKDKVSVISFDVKLSDANRALRVSAGLIAAAQSLDLKMREAVIGEVERQISSDLNRKQAELTDLGPHEPVDLSTSVTDGLSGALRERRTYLSTQLGGILRNDPAAADMRAEIAAINERLRAVALVEAGASAVSQDLIEARRLVTQWQADETERRAAVTSRESARDQLEQQIGDLRAKLAISISAGELERAESSQRVSVFAAPQIKSARLPSPGILAAASAALIGTITWLGGALLLEGANPRLRSAEDLVKRLNIAAFALIPDLGVTPAKHRRNGPDRGPQLSEPSMFLAGSRN